MSTTPYTVVLRKNPNQDSFGIYIGEDVPSGVYIVTVEPNTSAANSNIQPGDRILAVNGQLISSMTMNPREMVTQIASKAESLTLYMEPSDLLQSLDISLNNNFSNNKTFDLPSSNNFSLNKTFDLLSRNNFSNNNNYQYVSEESNGIDRELENYLKSVFGNQNLHIVPSSSNRNEYILTSDPYPYSYSYPYPYPSRPRRRHRKRRSKKTHETQTSTIDTPKENNSSVVQQQQQQQQQRLIPSMGTPHAILRNTQLNPKDNEINEVPEIKPVTNPSPPLINSDVKPNEQAKHTPEPVFEATPSYDASSQESTNSINTPRNQQSPFVGNRPPTNNTSGLREIRIHRSPNFNGFGFHLQYNKLYYIIHEIEPNSPADKSGLRPNDVIIKLNNQSTDQMPHKTFVQIVNASTDIVLLVEHREDYIRHNPQPSQPLSTQSTNIYDNRKDEDKPQNFLSRALSKLTSR